MRSLLFFLLCFAINLPAQDKIIGIVTLQSSGKAPLKNVEVFAPGANKDHTNDNGYFELVFANKKPGDAVPDIQFLLDGYRVLNKEKCRGLFIPSEPDFFPLMIVMCKEKEYNEQLATYYDIIIKNANNILENDRQVLLKQIEKIVDKVDSKEVERNLLARIRELEKANVQLKQNAEFFAKQFADIDLDAASQLAIDALALFNQGKIKEAIILLDSEVLEKNMLEAKKAVKIHRKGLLRADSAIKQGVANYMIKARLQKINLNWVEAKENYLKAIEADSLNVDNLIEVGRFLSLQKYNKTSTICFQKAIDLLEYDQRRKARVLNLLGSIHANNNQSIKAEKAYLTSIKIYENLSMDSSEIHDFDYAEVQNNIGLIYKEYNNYEKAESSYLIALKIFERLAKQLADEYNIQNLSNVLGNLGSLYFNHNNYPKAEKAFLRVLKLRQILVGFKPSEFEDDLAGTYNNLGRFYEDIHNFPESERYYLESLEIYKRLAKINPKRYESEYAVIQLNLGSFYSKINDVPQKAIKLIKNSLNIYERLVRENPQTYEPKFATTLNNLGLIYLQNNDLRNAEKYLLYTLEIRQKLDNLYPVIYEFDLAGINQNLGILYSNLGKFQKAKRYYSNAVKIFNQLSEKNPKKFNVFVARVYNDLGAMYLRLGNNNETLEAFFTTYKIFKKLSKDNPKQYSMHLGRTAMNISYLYQQWLIESEDWFCKDLGLLYGQEALQAFLNYPENTSHAEFYRDGTNDLVDYFESLTPSLLTIESLKRKIKNESSYASKLYLYQQLLDYLLIQPKGVVNSLDLATTYWNQSWVMLFIKDFPGAEQAALNALKYGLPKDIVDNKLAVALLFQGKFEDAKNIVLKYTDNSFLYNNLKELILKDLEDLVFFGITHQDVSKMRQYLKTAN